MWKRQKILVNYRKFGRVRVVGENNLLGGGRDAAEENPTDFVRDGERKVSSTLGSGRGIGSIASFGE